MLPLSGADKAAQVLVRYRGNGVFAGGNVRIVVLERFSSCAPFASPSGLVSGKPMADGVACVGLCAFWWNRDPCCPTRPLGVAHVHTHAGVVYSNAAGADRAMGAVRSDVMDGTCRGGTSGDNGVARRCVQQAGSRCRCRVAYRHVRLRGRFHGNRRTRLIQWFTGGICASGKHCRRGCSDVC